MENLEYWDKKIESLQEQIHTYHFSNDIEIDKNSIIALLTDLKTAHSEKRKLLIREKKLQDTRSFWRKKWDFCKENPSFAFFLLLVWICIFMVLFCIGFYIYLFGFGAFINKAGEFILGIFSLLLVIGFLGGLGSIMNSIKGS